MRKKILFAFLVLVGCMFISSNAFSAWTQAKGHSYNQVTASHYKTSSKYTTIDKYSEHGNAEPAESKTSKDGEIKRTNHRPFKTEEEEFTSSKLSYYGEYGINDNLTGIFSAGWDYVTSNDIKRYGDSDGVSGVGDIVVGLRQKISDNIGGGALMSVEGQIKIPEAYHYENPINFQNLGDGQYDYILKLKFGRGFSFGYTVLDVGYKYRDENDKLEPYTFKPSDQYFVSLSGGYNAAPKLSIRGKLEWAKSIGNAKVSQEFVDYAACCGVKKDKGDQILILDSLGLEQDSLTAGLALALTVAKNTQVVLSYDRTLAGFGDISTKNASMGETWSLALALSL